ncbi:MAG: hypothetical protein ACMUIP_01040 [bacterium]
MLDEEYLLAIAVTNHKSVGIVISPVAMISFRDSVGGMLENTDVVSHNFQAIKLNRKFERGD